MNHCDDWLATIDDSHTLVTMWRWCVQACCADGQNAFFARASVLDEQPCGVGVAVRRPLANSAGGLYCLEQERQGI